MTVAFFFCVIILDSDAETRKCDGHRPPLQKKSQSFWLTEQPSLMANVERAIVELYRGWLFFRISLPRRIKADRECQGVRRDRMITAKRAESAKSCEFRTSCPISKRSFESRQLVLSTIPRTPFEILDLLLRINFDKEIRIASNSSDTSSHGALRFLIALIAASRPCNGFAKAGITTQPKRPTIPSFFSACTCPNGCGWKRVCSKGTTWFAKTNSRSGGSSPAERCHTDLIFPNSPSNHSHHI